MSAWMPISSGTTRSGESRIYLIDTNAVSEARKRQGESRRHRERKRGDPGERKAPLRHLDCFVATLLAMTDLFRRSTAARNDEGDFTHASGKPRPQSGRGKIQSHSNLKRRQSLTAMDEADRRRRGLIFGEH